MSKHKSLVVFTLLIQSAVGSFWCIGIALLLGGNHFRSEWHLFVALLLVLAGLGFSTGHLGRPAVCFYAIRNLRQSWLSREIAATVTLATVLVVAVLTGFWSGSVSGWLVLALSLIGGMTLYAMARSYRIRTVPPWNRAGTLFGFLGSALLLGGLQYALVSRVLSGAPVVDCGPTGLCLSRYLGLLVALVGLVVKVHNQRTNHSQMATSGMWVRFSGPVLQVGGIVWWVASMILEDSVGLQWIFLMLAVVFLVVGEIIHRTRFYVSHRTAGL